jgi:hypothetical protein
MPCTVGFQSNGRDLCSGIIAYQEFDKITLLFRPDFFMTYPVQEEIWSSDYVSESGKISQNITIVSLTAALVFRVL